MDLDKKWTEDELEKFSEVVVGILREGNTTHIKFKPTKRDLLKIGLALRQMKLSYSNIELLCQSFKNAAVTKMRSLIRKGCSWETSWDAPNWILVLETSFGIIKTALQEELDAVSLGEAPRGPLEELSTALERAVSRDLEHAVSQDAAAAAAVRVCDAAAFALDSCDAVHKLSARSGASYVLLHLAWQWLYRESLVRLNSYWSAGDCAAMVPAAQRCGATHWRVADMALRYHPAAYITQETLTDKIKMKSLTCLYKLIVKAHDELDEDDRRQAGGVSGGAAPGGVSGDAVPGGVSGGAATAAARLPLDAGSDTSDSEVEITSVENDSYEPRQFYIKKVKRVEDFILQLQKMKAEMEIVGEKPEPPGMDWQREKEMWTRVLEAYTSRGRYAPALALQRRWLELRRLARHAVLQYWAEPAPARAPHLLLMRLVVRFPEVVLCALPSWSELVRRGRVLDPPPDAHVNEIQAPAEQVASDSARVKTMLKTYPKKPNPNIAEKDKTLQSDLPVRGHEATEGEVQNTHSGVVRGREPHVAPAATAPHDHDEFTRTVDSLIHSLDNIDPSLAQVSIELENFSVDAERVTRALHAAAAREPNKPTAHTADSSRLDHDYGRQEKKFYVNTNKCRNRLALRTQAAAGSYGQPRDGGTPGANDEKLKQSVRVILTPMQLTPAWRQFAKRDVINRRRFSTRLLSRAAVERPGASPRRHSPPPPAPAAVPLNRKSTVPSSSGLSASFLKIERNLRFLAALKPARVILERLPLHAQSSYEKVPADVPTDVPADAAAAGVTVAADDGVSDKRPWDPYQLVQESLIVIDDDEEVAAPTQHSRWPGGKRAPAEGTGTLRAPTGELGTPHAPAGRRAGATRARSGERGAGGEVDKQASATTHMNKHDVQGKSAKSKNRKKRKKDPIPSFESPPVLSPQEEWERQKKLMTPYFNLPSMIKPGAQDSRAMCIGEPIQEGRRKTKKVTDIIESMKNKKAAEKEEAAEKKEKAVETVINVSDDDDDSGAAGGSTAAGRQILESLLRRPQPLDYNRSFLRAPEPAGSDAGAWVSGVGLPVIASVTSLAPQGSAGAAPVDSYYLFSVDGDAQPAAADANKLAGNEMPKSMGIALSLHRSMCIADYVVQRPGSLLDPIIRLDSSRPLWTILEDYILVTPDYIPIACPTYWTAACEGQSCTQICFPRETSSSYPETLVCECTSLVRRCDLCTCLGVLGSGERREAALQPAGAPGPARIKVRDFARVPAAGDDARPLTIHSDGKTFRRTGDAPLTYESVDNLRPHDTSCKIVNNVLYKRLYGDTYVKVLSAVSDATHARRLARAGRPLRCSAFRTNSPAPPQLLHELQRIMAQRTPPTSPPHSPPHYRL